MTITTTFAHVNANGEDYLFRDNIWEPHVPPKPYRTLSTAEKHSYYDETLDEYQARRGKNIQ